MILFAILIIVLFVIGQFIEGLEFVSLVAGVILLVVLLFAIIKFLINCFKGE